MKERLKQFIRYHVIKKWFERYERFLMPATLLGGIIFDSFTFANIDIHAAFILLGFYFVLSGTLIAYLQRVDGGHMKRSGNIVRYVRLAAPFMIQFAFGAMLNATFIFYVFSGSFVVSWPFIVPVVALPVRVTDSVRATPLPIETLTSRVVAPIAAPATNILFMGGSS
jgi:hypothetical protein